MMRVIVERWHKHNELKCGINLLRQYYNTLILLYIGYYVPLNIINIGKLVW